MTSLLSILNKISDVSRRRSNEFADINADHVGYRPSGDPRLDHALSAQRFH